MPTHHVYGFPNDWHVLAVCDNGSGYVTDEGIPSRRLAERIARVRDVQ
jgi:hypothetical protein